MKDFLLSQHYQIPAATLFSLITAEKDSLIFIKNLSSVYQYANAQFIKLMGLKNIKEVFNQTDHELCPDKKKVTIYQQHDEEVFETEKALSVNEEILLQKNELLKKQMIGNLYPLFSKGSKPTALLGIVKPKYLPFQLTIEEALNLTTEEVDNYLVRRSYPVTVFGQKISMTKREIQCLIELIKGKHAGEIAHSLALKQSTIEFYLDNIKNKLGATSKSSLIMTVFQQKIIQQVML